jgi:type IX secretion system PorP/SprF family membrane protein
MRNKKYWIIALFMYIMNGYSQQDFRISHGEIADVYRNPAMAGSTSSLSVFVLHRRQWVSLPGAPSTSLIGFSKRLNKKIGGAVGLQIADDQIGSLKYNNLKLMYAKDFRFGISELRIGGAIIGNFLKINKTNWITSDLEVDTELSQGRKARSQYVDGSFGLAFKRNDLTIGMAISRIRNANLADLNWQMNRSYNAWLGYKLQWGDKVAFNTTPMIRVITDELSSPQIEGRIDTEINNKFWLLAGYRYGESALLGFSYIIPVGAGKMMFGYVFDYGLNTLAEYNSGSHELMLKFNLDKIQVNEKNEIKNVRFL